MLNTHTDGLGFVSPFYNVETKEVVDSLRSTIGYGEQGRRMGLQSELVGLLKKKGGTTSA